ncbi:MAG TPA: hypothetical protein DEF07_10170 [Nitrosomonas sp.]|nr:hypothetical protein [Nitrosomonas sp.]
MAKHNRIDGNSGIRKQCNDQSYNQLHSDVATIQLDLEVCDAKLLYRNARTMKEKALALRAAVEYEKRIGSLISKALVEKFVFELVREFRDGLTACACRLSPEIAGKTDIAEIEAILNEEHRQLLNNFANTIASRKTTSE